jgi:hypothetical protein
VAEAGPAASHFGVFAALFVDASLYWQELTKKAALVIIQLGSEGNSEI